MVSDFAKRKGTMALSCSQAKAWVKTHYEKHEDGVVAKSVMYKHYEDYCKEQGRTNMETSIFGRVVKSVFPDVTIRRLGGRDNLKYYYCGIRAKETSPYAIDNTTTTRPKRRLRKRELVTNKMEVDNCLRWLHANFTAANESSVIKTDVYDRYVSYCRLRVGEPLSIQYFGMVVTHAFPNVTKRKLGPRTNQQKYYFGIRERTQPMSPESIPSEYINVEAVLGSNKSTYRDNSNEQNDEDEDFSCRSPLSDTSELANHSVSYEEVKGHSSFPQYTFSYYMNDEAEPVDYSLGSLKLKTEGNDEEELNIKYENIDRDSVERRTPDRPPSVSAAFGSNSPIHIRKDNKTKKIYKPRFHFDYNNDSSSEWNNDTVSKEPEISTQPFLNKHHMQADSTLKKWILNTFESHSCAHVNRQQIYDLYEKYCNFVGSDALPLTYFDETMLKSFPGVVTNIQPTGKTYYAGIRVIYSSPLRCHVEEFLSMEDDVVWADDSASPPIEMSSPEESSHSSPLPLYDDDINEVSYNDTGEDSCPSPEVLRDGKFFLRKWLKDNFESVSDSCVLKAEAYKHYENYVRSINQTPFEMNVFGKIVWQVFPNVSVRRLGGRSKPQYHYCGITVKQTSPLFHVMSGKDPAQRSRKKEIATDNRSAEIVIDWLRENYEPGEEKIITKSEVFDNYNSYSLNLNEIPVTLNYFGKLVKHCFPSVEVRKFGGRSDPTWYYYGLIPRGRNLAAIQTYNKESLPHLIDMRMSSHQLDETMSPSIIGNTAESCLEIHHQPTNPIPISIDGSRSFLSTPSSHSYGSPSTYPEIGGIKSTVIGRTPPGEMYNGTPSKPDYQTDRLFFQESPISASHLDLTYGRELHKYHIRNSPLYDSPSDPYSRSPAESDGHGPYISTSAGSLPKENFHLKISNFNGQVVPSQTPPKILSGHGPEQGLTMLIHTKLRKKPLNTQEYAVITGFAND